MSKMILILVLLMQDAQIDRLIEELGHDNAAVREKATSALMKIGAKARPILQKAEKGQDAEVAARARLVLADIELNRLLEPVFKPYPALTLKVENTPYRDVLASITHQTGVKFDGSVNSNNTLITGSWQDKPFIQVMDELAKQAGNRWLYGDQAVCISGFPTEIGPACYTDGIKIALNRVDVYRSHTFTGGDHGLLWIYIGTSLDPGIKPLRGPRFTVTSAIDASDRILEFDSQAQDSSINSSRPALYESSPFTLNSLDRDTRNIRLLRGTASFVFPMDSEEVTINVGGEENVTTIGDITVQTASLGPSIQLIFTKTDDPQIIDYIDRTSVTLLAPGDIPRTIEVRFDQMAADSFRLTLEGSEHEEVWYDGSIKFKLYKKLHVKTVSFEFTNIEVP